MKTDGGLESTIRADETRIDNVAFDGITFRPGPELRFIHRIVNVLAARACLPAVRDRHDHNAATLEQLPGECRRIRNVLEHLQAEHEVVLPIRFPCQKIGVDDSNAIEHATVRRQFDGGAIVLVEPFQIAAAQTDAASDIQQRPFAMPCGP